MKNFNTFINESYRATINDNVTLIKTIMEDLKHIDCNIVFDLFGSEYVIKEINYVENNFVSTVEVKYTVRFKDGDIQTRDTLLTGLHENFIEIIFNYLRDNYEEYEYLFSGKEMGLL